MILILIIIITIIIIIIIFFIIIIIIIVAVQHVLVGLQVLARRNLAEAMQLATIDALKRHGCRGCRCGEATVKNGKTTGRLAINNGKT